MVTPFEISEHFREMDKRSTDILDGLVKKAQGIIGQYEILGFEFLRVERNEATREVSIVFRHPGGTE